MIEAKQIRAARALLDWTRDDLAKASGVSVPALSQIETAARAARTASLDKIREALENAGVQFTDNSGVKLKSDVVAIYENTDGLHRWFDHVYLTTMNTKADVIISGGLQQDFHETLGKEYLTMHAERMAKIEGLKMRALKPYSRAQEPGLAYIEFRFLPDHMFMSVPFYIYGNSLAIITWRPNIRIVVINDAPVAEAYRQQFDLIWKSARREVSQE